MKQLTAIKNFVVKHKTPILVITTVVSTTLVVAQRAGLKQHDDFLKEHDLYDAFYLPEY